MHKPEAMVQQSLVFASQVLGKEDYPRRRNVELYLFQQVLALHSSIEDHNTFS